MESGRYSLATSISATFMGMSLNEMAQLVAFVIAIISGVMAIRHYWMSAKLSKLQIEKLQTDQSKSSGEDREHKT